MSTPPLRSHGASVQVPARSKKGRCMPVNRQESKGQSQNKARTQKVRSDQSTVERKTPDETTNDQGFSGLVRQWEAGIARSAGDRYALGKLALQRRNFPLARDVFQSLLDCPHSGIRKGLSKQFIDDIKQCLLYADIMARAQEAPAPRRVSGPKLKTTGGQREAPPPEAPGGAPVVELSPPPVPCRIEESPFRVEIPKLRVAFKISSAPVIDAIRQNRRVDDRSFDLALQAYRHSFRVSYDQLICLPTLSNIQSLWYQEETARKVMKDFRGRAILADEVGLGKTIEAGLVLKEYLARGLVKSALVLAPSSLVNQWQEELRDKFGLEFLSSNDAVFRQDPARFWAQPFIIASLHTARTDRHFDAVTSRAYDLIIVDEAHHLKNQATKTWKLVNAVQKTFLLLLTATPVQNKLDEIYNLVTILRPGHLKTRTAFKEEFITRGSPTDPRNRERLRTLLKEVMIRNTRSITRLRLPARFAYTTRVSPSESEAAFYQGVSKFVSDCVARRVRGMTSMACRRLLEAAGSSHQAAVGTLERLTVDDHEDVRRAADGLVELGKSIDLGSKARKVLELLRASPDRKIIFVNYLATLESLHRILEQNGIGHVMFHGSLTAAQKKAAIDVFRGGCPVLLSSGTGGEGHNLQFCHMMINYDLPWNPMEIEQRIGRIHRIGQEKEVQVHNFCAKGSIEDHVMEVLDRKINMFELVVGEIDMILGRLQDDKEFADMVFEIWTAHPDEKARRQGFEQLAGRLKRARSAHEKTKELDEKLFREDFGI
jgi:superfamily II DNA or RNA helicase